jgi:predicted ArsR family transcriptional regulator
LRIDPGWEKEDLVAAKLMLLPVLQDLLKPQWRQVIETLRHQGSLPAGAIARLLDGHYMTVKAHCDQLADAGYLVRARLPRDEVGRPEIFYSLSAKADALFPQAGVDFTLELLDLLRQMHGENSAEKLLFQYFTVLTARLEKQLDALKTPEERAQKLAGLRCMAGYDCRFENSAGKAARLIEAHNPLGRIIAAHPHAAGFEQRMIERLLGTRVVRHEIPGGREATPRVIFELV